MISERTPRAPLPGTFLSSKEEGCRKPLPGVCSERQEDDKESSQLVSSSILTSGQPHKLTSGQKKKKKKKKKKKLSEFSIEVIEFLHPQFPRTRAIVRH